MGAQLPTGEATTLAGFLPSRFRRLPAVDEEFTADGLRFVTEAVSDRRIQRLRVAPP